ncbi:hypothetical protein [uncultured Methanobrevibacter sp.]|uniref:hypothetical protein n=1 Tax=uncultured Methanobrevibacter sp. TaxID=253161 RepID=UPI0025EAC183|nr:hypothetical protein [uncultured Methanobrevibacter sp.]
MNKRLDITEFPRTDTNDLNWIEFYKYWAIVEDLDEKTESEFNAHLRKVFRDEYGMGRNENVQTC